MSELPTGWAACLLEDLLGQLENGKILQQGWSPQCESTPAAEGEWGVLKTTAVQDGHYLEKENKKLPITLPPKPELEIKAGDLLMTCAGPRSRCGVICYINNTRKQLIFSGKIYRFRANHRIVNPKFLTSLLRTTELKEKIDDIKTGISDSGMNMTRDRFFSLPVRVAPLNEQTRIAQRLDELLAHAHSLKTRVEVISTLIKRFRQSVLSAAVSGQLTEEWRANKTAPQVWSTVTLGKIVDKIEAGKNLKCFETPPKEDEYGIIKISAVTWGKYDESQSKTLPTKNHFIESRRIQEGDFLISRANTLQLLGNPVIVENTTKNLMLSDKVLRLVMPNDKKSWLKIFLTSNAGRREIESRATGNQLSMRNIGQRELLEIPVPNPSHIEIREIVRRVEQLFAFADQLEFNVASAKKRIDNLTQSILAKAFRGELVPQDPNDEPASVLLERIKAQRAAAPKAKRGRKASA
jgi:type I restriction enzyme, S subunit